jgi:diadenosine tetraphosphate (Ap4A) HIT family hydrolase
MHLIPRNHGDPIAVHGRQKGDPERLAENARRIAAALADIP